MALITGAAQGIGAATAAALAREDARVLLTDLNEAGARDRAEAINSACDEEVAHAMPHDVASEADWLAVIDGAEALFGGLSVLVNNAGIVVSSAVD